MHELPLQPHPPAHGQASLLAGFSGGLDSTVLLHRLAADPTVRARGLRAIHVHHGLHPHADDWAAQCAQACAALGIALDVVRVEVPLDRGAGLEAAARAARHAACVAALRDGEVLVLAHHRDDQAETFLLRALRGSGPDGLGAMQAWRRFGRGWLWRPLLEVPRALLEHHAREHRLQWIEDPSNADEGHDRNFLRRQVLPLLGRRWPQAAASLSRCAQLQRETRLLLDDEDARALALVRCIDPACVDADALATLPPARRARVLRRWLAELGLPPLPTEGVARIEHELLAADAATAPEFGWQHAVVRRWRGLLWAERRRAALPARYRAAWDGGTPHPLPTGERLLFVSAGDADDIPARTTDGPYVVHAREGGERIVLPGRGHSHALKHVLQDLGVPPWQRARLPLLSSPDGRLLAAGDLVLSAAFDTQLKTHGQRLVLSPAAS
jgi:tRNA(Ile)-lysidine synthase